jgi:hypothetical protein
LGKSVGVFFWSESQQQARPYLSCSLVLFAHKLPLQVLPSPLLSYVCLPFSVSILSCGAVELQVYLHTEKPNIEIWRFLLLFSGDWEPRFKITFNFEFWIIFSWIFFCQ